MCYCVIVPVLFDRTKKQVHCMSKNTFIYAWPKSNWTDKYILKLQYLQSVDTLCQLIKVLAVPRYIVSINSVPVVSLIFVGINFSECNENYSFKNT